MAARRRADVTHNSHLFSRIKVCRQVSIKTLLSERLNFHSSSAWTRVERDSSPVMPTNNKTKGNEKRVIDIPRNVPWRGAQMHVKVTKATQDWLGAVKRKPVLFWFNLQRRVGVLCRQTADDTFDRGDFVAFGCHDAVASGGRSLRSKGIYKEDIAKIKAFIEYALPAYDLNMLHLERNEATIFCARVTAHTPEWERLHTRGTIMIIRKRSSRSRIPSTRRASSGVHTSCCRQVPQTSSLATPPGGAAVKNQ